MKKVRMDFIFTAIGMILLVTGLLLAKTFANSQGFMLVLPYIFFGIGCGIFGHGMGNIISRKVLKNNPEIQKQLKIDKTDERNIAIANRAKAKAYDMIIFVFGALMLTFALRGVDVIAMLLFLFAYLFVQGYGIYFRYKYDKEM